LFVDTDFCCSLGSLSATQLILTFVALCAIGVSKHSLAAQSRISFMGSMAITNNNGDNGQSSLHLFLGRHHLPPPRGGTLLWFKLFNFPPLARCLVDQPYPQISPNTRHLMKGLRSPTDSSQGHKHSSRAPSPSESLICGLTTSPRSASPLGHHESDFARIFLVHLLLSELMDSEGGKDYLSLARRSWGTMHVIQ
jgi:hypothetical protein